MSKSTRKSNRARSTKVRVSPYGLLDYHTGEDGEARESVAWTADHRTVYVAAQNYLRYRDEVLRTAVDDLGTLKLKETLAYQVEEVSLVMNRTTRRVAATITRDWKSDDLWATIDNLETGQILQQKIVIPLVSPYTKSA